MFAIRRSHGIPEEIVRAIRVLYDDSTSNVFVDGKFSKEFKVSTGVLRGDALAPSLFIIVMDYVMREAEGEFGFVTHLRQPRRMPEQRLNDLAYANDIALLEGSLIRDQHQLDRTNNSALKAGREINVGKTKRMELNTSNAAQGTLTLNGEPIELVADFKYLGSIMASSKKDIKHRKSLAWVAFWKMETIWRAKQTRSLSKSPSLRPLAPRFYCTEVKHGFSHSSKRKEIDSFATDCYRIMLRIKRI
ncbi:unnamed protein product [Didymodactylos carnosus]|uniref:Reverse transcriptase domain-containing protein n=1 Tax=Didymodactylos carnosus TaxID=1234261 RepID=A0A815L2N1_9BILA|nr:unnamed protein product [Didymodactylos carnosus]CAF4295145.1 unnamed protein product [Didymodactylos carnosus]